MSRRVGKKMKKTLIPLFVATLLLSGCSFSLGEETSNASSEADSLATTSSEDKPSEETPSEQPSVATSQTEEPKYKMYNGFSYPSEARYDVNANYVEFWSPDTKIMMEIEASPAIWKLMDQHGHIDSITTNDLYWPVTVTFDINGRKEVFEEVGMRRRGNSSRNYYFMDGDVVNTAFSFKLSFNELWDEEIYKNYGNNIYKSWTKTDPEWVIRDDREFLRDEEGRGHKKLDFKMYKTGDHSMINQQFAFSLFQKEGLIAQNSTLAAVKVKSGANESNMGVITINEPINKHLIRRYFSRAEAGGELYKVGWDGAGITHGHNKGNLRFEDYENNNLIIGEEDKFLPYEPRYDAKEYDDKLPHSEAHAKLINLMKVLKDNETKTPSEYIEAIEAVVDMPSFLNYAALAYLTGNQDDMRNNGNNYYIYFLPSNGKAHFIPYDYDWALGLGYNDDGGLSMANLSPFHSKLQGNNRNEQDNRLFMYTIIDSQDGMYNIETNKAWQNAYYKRIQDVVASDFFSKETFNDLFNKYKHNYDALTFTLNGNNHEVTNGFQSTNLFSEYYDLITQSVTNNPPA